MFDFDPSDQEMGHNDQDNDDDAVEKEFRLRPQSFNPDKSYRNGIVKV